MTREQIDDTTTRDIAWLKILHCSEATNEFSYYHRTQWLDLQKQAISIKIVPVEYISCLETISGCWTAADRYTCLHGKDGRAKYLNQPCVWCGGSECTSNSSRCEPETWLMKQSNQLHPENFEFARDSCDETNIVSVPRLESKSNSYYEDFAVTAIPCSNPVIALPSAPCI